MSSTTHVTMSSQHTGMLSLSKSPLRSQVIDASSQPSQRGPYRQKEVIDGDVVRTYATSHRRPHFSILDGASKQRQTPQWLNATRERELQAAMELPSSVLVAQSLRRLLNSDEPLYDVIGKEQKKHLRREFLEDIGVVESKGDDASRKTVMFPPSPPMTPKPNRSRPVKPCEVVDERFCQCCKAHCAR
jgi:hypothetical protein